MSAIGSVITVTTGVSGRSCGVGSATGLSAAEVRCRHLLVQGQPVPEPDPVRGDGASARRRGRRRGASTRSGHRRATTPGGGDSTWLPPQRHAGWGHSAQTPRDHVTGLRTETEARGVATGAGCVHLQAVDRPGRAHPAEVTNVAAVSPAATSASISLRTSASPSRSSELTGSSARPHGHRRPRAFSARLVWRCSRRWHRRTVRPRLR